MNNPKSVFLKILFALEIVVCVRILLFTVPVFISRMTLGESLLGNPGDQWIVLLTAVGVVYLITGLVSFFKASLGKIFHLLAFAITAAIAWISTANAGMSVMSAAFLGGMVLGVTLAAAFIKPE